MIYFLHREISYTAFIDCLTKQQWDELEMYQYHWKSVFKNSPLLFSLFVSDLNELYSDTNMGIDIVDTIMDMQMFTDNTVILVKQ